MTAHEGPASNPPTSRLRASDDDREQTIARLRDALTNGQLAIGEFDDRAELAYRATFRDELSGLLSDLDVQASDSRDVAAQSRSEVTIHPGESGNRFSLGLMGAAVLSDDWTLARRHFSVGLMGATSLDLSEVRLTAQETVIHAYGLLGAVEIKVPEDVRVVGDGFGIMGAFAVSDGDGVTIRQSDLPADAPVVRVRGAGLLGAVGIIRIPREGQIKRRD